jgi:anti-sigma-K factor RskA
MFNHEYLEYIPAYAAGALSVEDAKRLEEHLSAGCDICEPELLIYGATVSKLPLSLAPVALPSNLKSRVHARLERESLLQPVIKPQRSMVPYLLLAASLAVAIFAGFLYWNTNLELNRQKSLLASRESQITEMQQVMQNQKAEINWLRDPGVQLALLTGMVNGNETKGKMIWHPVEHKGIFYVQSLPPLVSDKSYQLWVIGNQGPVSAGVFEPDRSGSAVLTVQRIEAPVDGPPIFAVTIEPYGGVPKPTGTPIMTGKPL